MPLSAPSSVSASSSASSEFTEFKFAHRR
jgi:hypothetical protein